MKEWFFQLADAVFAGLTGDELASLSLDAERSSFARLDHAKVRQAGDVAQDVVTLTLIRGRRHAAASRTLGGRAADDAAALRAALADLRAVLEVVPDDPHLLYDEHPRTAVDEAPDGLPPAPDAVAAILAAGAGHDLVGLWQSGAIHRGFASSLGHRLLRTSHSFHLDFTLYAQRDKAAKGRYAGTRFDDAALRDRIGRAARQVEILRRPEQRIAPGDYRVYLAPGAMLEIADLIAWTGFGAKGHRAKQTVLLRMLDGGDARLAPAVSLAEDAATGVAPPFLPGGFARPPRVDLITGGRLTGELVSPRSAKEYGLDVNTGAAEIPSSLAMAAGDLAEADVLSRLGTGIYVTDTWYTNYSDISAGRITGMTRFATSWVEDGELVAPLAVMRFDDTIYRMLGTELEAVTAEREWLLDGSTYGGRSTGSMLLPGVLLRAMTFTL
jgi:predicted Zn-dependent protease